MTYHPHHHGQEDESYISHGQSGGHEDYAKQDEYQKDPSDEYSTGKGEEDKAEEEGELSEFEAQLKGEDKKYEEKKDSDDQAIARKAANEVFAEIREEKPAAKGKKKPSDKSIEDAINKALEQEKEVIYKD
ncbi:hypothetical protein HYU14_04855 [Candidatus Woesearchaeota archaeon]|nr:hypothetical protein [Candidatus Woesearchaeota archaeon]